MTEKQVTYYCSIGVRHPFRLGRPGPLTPWAWVSSSPGFVRSSPKTVKLATPATPVPRWAASI